MSEPDLSVCPTTAVIGAGAWGTVFSQVLADCGSQVRIWGRNQKVINEINAGTNSRYVPGIRLPAAIKASTDPAWVLALAPVVVLAIPSDTVRTVLTNIKPYLRQDAVVVSLVKGVEQSTDLLMTEVIQQVLELPDERIVAISGPNLSAEIARREPTGAVVACRDIVQADRIASLCHTSYFRPYVSADVTGCEVAGATKNVIAMAMGAADGLGLGVNSRAMLLTRGMAEITRLGIALGGHAYTFMGLAGIGDLMATCSSKLSRNYMFGFNIGRGMSVTEALQGSVGVVEGMRSCRQIQEIARRLDADIPITNAVVEVIYEGKNIKTLGQTLMDRPRRMDGLEVKLMQSVLGDDYDKFAG